MLGSEGKRLEIEKGYSPVTAQTPGSSSMTRLAVNKCTDVMGAADWQQNPQLHMGCKVPSSLRPQGLLETRGLPPATCLSSLFSEGSPAAHTDRMLQKPPDIATRSQSAGRWVNHAPPTHLSHRHPPSWRACLLWSIPRTGSFHHLQSASHG